jgi:branched-chain amino acid transport system substrate-binding protein
MGSVTAVQMAVEDFGGKVLGVPIEVLSADHLNKADVALGKAREWFDSQKVDMIANLVNSGIALGVSNLAKEKNRIAIVTTSGSSRLTNDSCNLNTIHYSYDTWALSNGTARALIDQGLDTWYFLTADYAFGHALETDTSSMIKSRGGKVLGSIRYPLETIDHSSFLLQAQASKAKVIALAGSGASLVAAVKSAREFNVSKNNQQIAGLLVWINDVHALGLEAAQGLILTNGFYWDRDEETRAWSRRFFERTKKMPNMGDAGDYSSTLHYLKSIQAAGTDEASAVMSKMKSLPIKDFFSQGGYIRADGRMIHDMYVYEVKAPSESKYPWDYYKLKYTIPAEKAFKPLSESTCPFIKK